MFRGQIDTSGLNKGFSISTPPREGAAGSKSYGTPSEPSTKAGDAWQTGAISGGGGGGGKAPGMVDGSGSEDKSKSALDFVGEQAGAGAAGAQAVGKKAAEAAEVAAAAAFSSGQESAAVAEVPVATAEVEKEEPAPPAWDIADAEAAVREAEALAEAASSAASEAAAAAGSAAGDAASSAVEVLSSESAGAAVSAESSFSSPAGSGGGGSADAPEEETGASGDAGRASPEESSLVAALREKEERDALLREELESKKRRIRNEALSTVAEEMEIASAGLKRELEQSVLKARLFFFF